MSKRIYGVLSIGIVILLAAPFRGNAQSSHPKELLEESAKAMGGVKALRSLKNQVVEKSGEAP